MNLLDHSTTLKASRQSTAVRLWLWFVVLGVGLFEVYRLVRQLKVDNGFALWLIRWHPETTLPLVSLIGLLTCWRPKSSSFANRHQTVQASKIVTCVLAVFIFVTSILCSRSIGNREIEIRLPFEKIKSSVALLPPAYHDEYSYLLAAETFAASRLSYPPAEIAHDEFHQFHVLNEHKTVSRYFPGTGFWLMLFRKAAHPYWAQWVAAALASVLFFLAVREISCLKIASIAGILIALSPGIALFGNLLLAHHVTLMMLALFLFGFLRAWNRRRFAWMFVAGCGLSGAMLSRPMTAAGFALPFGLYLVVQSIKQPFARKACVGFAIPLSMAFAFLAVMNQDATGSIWKTAYQQYTDQFTPRHRFGFGNGLEQPTGAGPLALQKYDQWATNLTAEKAIQNGATRLAFTAIWSLGVVACVLFGGLGCVAICQSQPLTEPRKTIADRSFENAPPSSLIVASFFSLHVVHLAYWYDGIMHWHYVFESGPLLLIVCAWGIHCLWVVSSRPVWVAVLCLFLLTTSLAGRWLESDIFLPSDRTVSAQLSQQLFARKRFALFRHLVDQRREGQPALVFVDEANSDPQLSYVINFPHDDQGFLTCRLPNSRDDLQQLLTHYADRRMLLFRPDSMLVTEFDPQAVDRAETEGSQQLP